MKTYSFQAGAAQTDITPPLGSWINGDFKPFRANTVHDPLYAKALVMQYGPKTIAFVVVDICGMQKKLLDAVKEQVFQQAGIAKEDILISSTHTHGAGSVASLFLCDIDVAYAQQLPALLIECLVLAKKNMRDAKITSGAIDVPEHLLCRRYLMKPGYVSINPVTGVNEEIKTNPFGGEENIVSSIAATDPQLFFLAVKGTDGGWISVLGNYSMHYVGDKEDDSITADYFGVFGTELRNELGAGSDFVGMLSNGTSGDVNIWDFLHPDRYPKELFEKSKLIGKDLAQKVAEALTNSQWETEPVLCSGYSEIELAVQKPTDSAFELARKRISQVNFKEIQLDDEGFKNIYAREQVLLHEYPEHISFPVQVLKIGSLLIGGLGGEFFSETGLALKNRMQEKKYFTITLANDYVGYVPPAHEFKRGGYETWRCRTCCLELDAEQRIQSTLLSLIDQTGF